MPSATGSDWEKHKKSFADDEKEEKKIGKSYAHSVSKHSCADQITLLDPLTEE
jgi:hypothetical protein